MIPLNIFDPSKESVYACAAFLSQYIVSEESKKGAFSDRTIAEISAQPNVREKSDVIEVVHHQIQTKIVACLKSYKEIIKKCQAEDVSVESLAQHNSIRILTLVQSQLLPKAAFIQSILNKKANPPSDDPSESSLSLATVGKVAATIGTIALALFSLRK